MGINIWVGNYGDYIIPDEIFDGVRLNKNGHPDKRSPLAYSKFMSWVKEMEDYEKENTKEN